MKNPVGILWFRRDLRTDDHPAGNAASRSGLNILPVFVFDPKIIDAFGGTESKPARFFFTTLLSLRNEFLASGHDLLLLEGPAEKSFTQLAEALQAEKAEIKKIFFHRDYEPDGLVRDQSISKWAKAHSIEIDSAKDHVFFEKNEIVNQSGEPYRVFTAYKNACFRELKENPPTPTSRFKLRPGKTIIPATLQKKSLRLWGKIESFTEHSTSHRPEAGEPAARKRLSLFIKKHLGTYSLGRNDLSSPRTSLLSPDLRTGALSIRRAWASAAQADAKPSEIQLFQSELLWRNFFTTLGEHFPHVFTHPFKRQYEQIAWRNDEQEFKAWCEGRTGFPVVDAGIRELLATGLMHNRARMITAMFLVKDLLVDWRWGEAFFRKHLLDGDLAVNNGNWQWCASTGCDAQPYFRIFNPTEQSKRYDPQGIYVRRWIPELETWKNQHFSGKDYPPPLVNHAQARLRCLKAYRME